MKRTRAFGAPGRPWSGWRQRERRVQSAHSVPGARTTVGAQARAEGDGRLLKNPAGAATRRVAPAGAPACRRALHRRALAAIETHDLVDRAVDLDQKSRRSSRREVQPVDVLR